MVGLTYSMLGHQQVGRVMHIGSCCLADGWEPTAITTKTNSTQTTMLAYCCYIEGPFLDPYAWLITKDLAYMLEHLHHTKELIKGY